MARYQQEQAGDDGWTRWVQPIRKGYKMSCCDCGLVHVVDSRVRGGRVQWRMRRDNRATGQVRRHMKGAT